MYKNLDYYDEIKEKLIKSEYMIGQKTIQKIETKLKYILKLVNF